MFSHTAGRRTDASSAELPSPAQPLSRTATAWDRVGTHLYLLSVALVAAATIGILFGMGSYLLVHPAGEMAADHAERDGASGESPPVPQPTLMLRQNALVASLAADQAQYPAAEKAEYADEGTETLHLAPGSPAGEAAPTTGVASFRDEVPTLSSAASEAMEPPAEAVIMSVLPGAIQSEIGQLAQPAETEAPLVKEADDVTPQNRVADKSPQSTVEPAENVPVPPGSPEQQVNVPADPASSEPISSAVVRGIVTDAPNAATWVIADRTIRLSGIKPQSSNAVASLVKWVRAKGPVECVPRAKTDRYQCFTATGEDIAEAALLAGVARAAPSAPAGYRDAEAQAHRKRKGLWGRK